MNTPTVRKINGTYYRRLADNEVSADGDLTDNPPRPICTRRHRPTREAGKFSTARRFGVWRKISVPEGYRILDLDETIPDFTRHLVIKLDGTIEEVGDGWVHWVSGHTVRYALGLRGVGGLEQAYLILAPTTTPSVKPKLSAEYWPVHVGYPGPDTDLEALRKENAVLKRRVDVYRRSVDRLRVTLGSVRKHNLELRHTNYAITQKLSKVREVVS